MAYAYSDLITHTERWAAQAVAQGWLTHSAAQTLLDIDARSPAMLFNAGESRPLMVAFMGGTGVGKSSLLNRLAGSVIAKSGAERPTSKEVTLFHHRSISVDKLPAGLPTSQTKIAQHDDAQNKNIVWIDMPDFDSTEQTNKQQVLQWLPHIDVLIYVVSPERYRDEKAWRLLLAEGGKHAWLFVINQWDRGQVEQYADFKQQLYKAGFSDPIIFTTSCTEVVPGDEFESLKTTILSLANDHTVAQLEQRGMQLKIEELRKNLETGKQWLGSEQAAKQLSNTWTKQWQKTSETLEQGFIWPIQRMARYYAEHAAALLGPKSDQPGIWDDWAQARLDDALDEVIVNVDQAGIPVAPYKQQFIKMREKAGKIIANETELAVRQALAKPGHLWQRAFLKFVRLCEIILPIAAISWVADQVFIGYYHSNQTSSHYLGMDFLIHSGLLIGISWLLPYFILKKLKPSLEASALRGLNKGLSAGLATIEAEMNTNINLVNQQQSQQIKALEAIMADSAASRTAPQTIDQQSPLNRMLTN